MDNKKERLLHNYHHPRNKGLVDSPDFSSGQFNPSCGDMVHINGTLANSDKVSTIGFTAEGCVLTQASASLLTELVKEKSIADVLALTKDDILVLLGIEIGPNRMRCALLPLHALQNALIKRDDK